MDAFNSAIINNFYFFDIRFPSSVCSSRYLATSDAYSMTGTNAFLTNIAFCHFSRTSLKNVLRKSTKIILTDMRQLFNKNIKKIIVF
jgi:hypothetical protein